MSLIKRNGGSPAIRTLFNDFFDIDRFFETTPLLRGTIDVPSVNIKENDSQYEIELAAPGLKKEDFKVEVDNNVLTISAEHDEEKKQEEKGYTRREYNYNSFSRSFQLPPTVNSENCGARYDNGILIIQLPKKEEARAKTQ
jgi:HSP20 family protein